MSFSSTANKIQLATNGVTKTFPFPYPFQQTSDLVVQLKDNTTLLVTTLVENTDYTVTTVGETGRFTSGTVVTTTAYALGSTLTIIRNVDNNQETANFNPGGDFDEQTTEDTFDKTVMLAQQIYNLAVILKKSGNVAGPLELPDLADNASKFLQINSAGTGITAADSSTTSDARVNSLFNGAAADDIFTTFINLVNGGLIIDGTGSPEGVKVAPVGSIFLRTDGGAGTSIYFKEAGAGDTGWVALSTPTITDFTNATHDHSDASNGGSGVNEIIDQGGGSNLKVKVVEIGDWDMDATATINVAHGLTYAKIRFATASIRNDGDTDVYMLAYTSAAGSLGGGVSWDNTNIALTRDSGGFFDNVVFDATSYNRGWITIWYTE
jgi:hypothetical protein